MAVKYKLVYGVTIFSGKKKLGEKHFKTEKDMAYWLYKNSKLYE